MKIVSTDHKNFKKPIVLALGFFDSLHIGHQQIIRATIEKAKSMGALAALFTFDNNPSETKGNPSKLVNLFSERIKILEKAGIDLVITAQFTKQFMSIGAAEFLSTLTSNFNLQGVVCGTDFRFGAKGLGDAKYLQEHIKNITVVDLVQFNNHKASTTDVRAAIKDGDIELANKVLISPYSISGKVKKGYGVGRNLGFPTANLDIPDEKQIIKDGVYVTKTEINGTKYNSITSVGTRKTFDDYVRKVETHLLDYSGQDFYASEIEVTFFARLRDMVKFDDKQQLSRQVEIDKQKARNYFENKPL